MFEFKLPDVGEGLTEAEIIDWRVSEGTKVSVNDVLVEIETAKSAVELPSPASGIVSKIHAEVGTTVPVGTVIVTIEDEPNDRPGKGIPGEAAPDEVGAMDPPPGPLVLVGTGPKPAVARTVHLGTRSKSESGQHSQGAKDLSTTAPKAKPPVRLLAKQLGIDLRTLHPSSGDTISRLDVERSAHSLTTSPSGVPGNGSETTNRETRIPIKGVRKATAAAMTRSAFTAPHVTEFLTVDVTGTMELLTRLKTARAWQGVRLTPLVLVARALLLAIGKHPEINARWDEAAQEIVQPHYVNLGLAAATPRGLIVPNVKNAQALDLRGLADAIESLVQTARAGKTTPDQMAGGTITISNIGALGVDSGTPILNPGEAAILAFGNVREMPWVAAGEVVVRQVTQLALSFDHRLIDGELGSNFLSTLGQLLRDPGEAFTLI